jgi:predicted secreted protein
MPISGFGTIFKYSSELTIGKLTSIGGMKFSADTIDVTNHQSTSGWREFISGLKDGGEVTIEGFFEDDDAGQLALFGDIGGDAQDFVVVFPDTSQWAFSALVTGVEMGKGDLKDGVPFSATVKITGVPEFTGATSTSTVTFTVTAAAGGAAISGATVIFHGETKTTNSSGVAIFYYVPYATYSWGVTKTSYVGQADTQEVNGTTEAVAVSLVAS